MMRRRFELAAAQADWPPSTIAVQYRPAEQDDQDMRRFGETVAAVASQVATDAIAERLEADRRRAHRREWMFFLAGLITSAVLSIPIGIWINQIS